MNHVLRPVKQSESGFTLIEMLVAMVIFSSLISVLMMGFRQGLLMWGKGQNHAQIWQAHEFRYRLLDSLITQTVLSDNQTKAGYALPWFDGTATSVRFISAAPMMDLQGHPRPIELQAIKSQTIKSQAITSDKQGEKGAWTLRYRQGARYSDVARGVRWNEDWVTLYRGLQSIAFAFEAPIKRAPQSFKRGVIPEVIRVRYRDKPEWMSQYDIAKLWVIPQTITLDFVDQQGIKHHWVFHPPQRSDAWPLGTYAGGF